MQKAFTALAAPSFGLLQFCCSFSNSQKSWRAVKANIHPGPELVANGTKIENSEVERWNAKGIDRIMEQSVGGSSEHKRLTYKLELVKSFW
jgi:hypothetical protein